MNTKLITLAVISAGLLLATSAQANEIKVDFTYTGPTPSTVTAAGWLDATALGVDLYHITGGSITIAGTSKDGNYTLVTAGPAVTYSPTGAFQVDNVYFDATDPHLDNWGALFGNGIDVEVNLWGNSQNNYSLYVGTAAGSYTTSNDGGQLSVVSVEIVPDGGMTIALLGGALIGLQVLRRKLA